MKTTILRKLSLIFSICLIVGMLGGCGQEVEQTINFENYSCSDEIKNNVFEPTDFYLVAHDSTVGEKFQGYQMPSIQIDDKCSIELGHTTLGEVYELFMGVSVEEQIRTARADDEGLLDKTPEEIEAEKQLLKQEEDSSKNKGSETTEETKTEPPYSFYLRFDEGEARSYAPIYLVSSDLVYSETVDIYKHGEPYVRLIISNFYGENRGIRQESDLIITGVEILPCKVKYADEDGLNLAAKKNVWLNGGFSFSGDNYEFQTIPRVFEDWGLSLGDGYTYNSEYFTRTEDENFYYYAQLYCFEPAYSVSLMHLNKTFVRCTVNRDTQKITALRVWLEEANSYYQDRYVVTQTRPEKVYGEDF